MTDVLIWRWRYLVLRALSLLLWRSLQTEPISEETQVKQWKALSAMDSTLDSLKAQARLP